MRILVVCASAVLVAGCSSTAGEQARETMPTLTPSGTASPATTTSAPPTTTTSRASAPATPPGDGAPIADVIAWVEAGESADKDDFDAAVRDGEVTELDGIAFTTPSGKTRCATGETSYDEGVLICLTTLADPPPAPPVVDGNWVSGWMDFPGAELTLGSVHGDPGIFALGDGAQLGYGLSLKFGDYRCRMDESGVYCVNYAHRSGMRISDAGVVPFGCLQPVEPETGGEAFRC
ncbi:MAG: hypothetical protein ACSLE6_14955 [Mycobacterium sp.]